MVLDNVNLIEGLNQKQVEAFYGLVTFIESKTRNEMSLLSGFAGTGKTFLCKRIIQHILNTFPKYKIAITAPTNKAVKVLNKSSQISHANVSFQTIHKLLGLKEEISNDGEQLFTKSKHDKCDIGKYNVLIIDEVSMLNDFLFNEVQKYEHKIKIIFMGDTAQIPPVNEPDCIPFRPNKQDEYNIRKFHLTDIVRQNSDNPIINATLQIRNNLLSKNPSNDLKTKLNDKNQGLMILDMKNKIDGGKILPLFNEYFNSEHFFNDADYCKIIAWRNVTVNSINEMIRELIYGKNIKKIVVGEKLISNAPIIDSTSKSIVFNTNDEFEVKSFNVTADDYFVTEEDEEVVVLSYYNTNVTYKDIGNLLRNQRIKILHEDSIPLFNDTADKLRKRAISLKGKNKSWYDYYNFIRLFADVNYNYACTIHKAQGSTYKNTFVVEYDINYNSNIIEKNKILYTAYSRPTDKLFILK